MAATSVFLNPSYNIDYISENTLNVLGPIVTTHVNAYSDDTSQPHNLVLGATSNIDIEALEDVNIYFDNENSLNLYNTKIINNVRSNISILQIMTSNSHTALSAPMLPLTITGTDTNSTTTISRTILATSNIYQTLSTTQTEFYFKNPVNIQQNLLVNDDVVSGNNIACAGNVFTTSMNLYRNQSIGSNMQIGYALHINEYEQLEIIKYNKYQEDNVVTSVKNRVATFGKTNSPYNVSDLGNATALDQFNGIIGNTDGLTRNMTSSILWGFHGSDCNIYYNAGFVGIGTSNPESRLHLQGDMKIKGHIIPEGDSLYDLGTSNISFRSLYLSGNSIHMQGASITLAETGSWQFNDQNNETSIDLTYITQATEYSSNIIPSIIDNASFTSNIIPSITAKASFTSNLIPSITEKAAFTSNLIPSITEKAVFTSNIIPSIIEKASFTSNIIPSIMQKAEYTSNLIPLRIQSACNLSDLNNVSLARNNLGLGSTDSVTFSNISIQGNFIPTQNHLQSLGTSNLRFKDAWVDSLHIATNTLYLGDTPVLGTESDTINIKADVDQSINIRTIGTGQTLVTSANGVQLSTSGMNAQVQIQSTGAGGKVTFGAADEISFTSPNTRITNGCTTSNLTVNGTLTVNGSQIIANVQTVEVKDNIMLLNSGQVGNGVSAGQAGLRIDRGDLNDYLMVFDETEDMFKVGEIGSLETIATRPWVSTNNLFKSSNLSDVANIATARNNLGLGTACNVTFGDLTLSGAFACTNFTNLVNTATSTSTILPPSANALKLVNDTILTTSNYAYGTWTTANQHIYNSTGSNFGFGTTTPQYKLHVVGEVFATGLIMSQSDSNLKTNVSLIENSLTKIDQINGYTFTYKNNPITRHAGVMAQEVQQVLPEVVTQSANGELNVAYGNLTALLINAVKELKKEVDTLKAGLNPN